MKYPVCRKISIFFCFRIIIQLMCFSLIYNYFFQVFFLVGIISGYIKFFVHIDIFMTFCFLCVREVFYNLLNALCIIFGCSWRFFALQYTDSAEADLAPFLFPVSSLHLSHICPSSEFVYFASHYAMSLSKEPSTSIPALLWTFPFLPLLIFDIKLNESSSQLSSLWLRHQKWLVTMRLML